MNPLLEIRNVYVKGPSRLRLNDINLSIYKGEKIALLGSSAAGKSTLLSVVNGITRPDHGQISYKGIKLSNLTNRQRSSITSLWQDLLLVNELNPN